MKTTFIFTLLFAALLPLPAQNITDLAVMNDRTADTFIGNGTQISSIDDSVFIHPDRIRYDRQCIQLCTNAHSNA